MANIATVQSPTFVAVLIFTLFVGLALVQRKFSGAKANGCRPAKRYISIDPFLGLEYIYKVFTDVAVMQRNRLRYGKTFIVDPLFATPMIVTSDAENIRAAFSGVESDWGNFWRRQPFEPFTGRGILTEDGEDWRSSRKMLRPVFAKNNIADLKFYGNVVDDLLRQVPNNGEVVDMHPLLLKAFMDNALHFVLDYDAQHPHADTPLSRDGFMRSWEAALEGLGLRLITGALNGLVPAGKFRAACAQVHAFVDFQINQVHQKKGGSTSQVMAESFITQSDDRVQVRSLLVQGIIGAQDTTSVLTSNTLYLLARQPNLWKELRVEVLKRGDDLLNFDALRTNETIQNILSESLRLLPVFPGIERRAFRDTILPTGGGPDGTSPIFVKRGTDVQASYYALHREESVFGPDVETYNPHRWKSIKPTQWEYMPFGAGPRSCLGKEKSLIEAGYLLAKLASRFEILESRDEKPWIGEIKLTCANKYGCKVAFKSKAAM